MLETQTGRRPHNEDKLLVQQLKVDGESRYVLAGKVAILYNCKFYTFSTYHFIAVFDGHGNDLCAKFCIEQFGSIVEQQFAQTNKPSEGVLKRSMKMLDDKWDTGVKNIYI